ncbi:PepSY domain-containing protein [Lactococcus allomyrinae]|nr:PepSY domain-containing protein [Lactococcus allomyrinae]
MKVIKWIIVIGVSLMIGWGAGYMSAYQWDFLSVFGLRSTAQIDTGAVNVPLADNTDGNANAADNNTNTDNGQTTADQNTTGAITLVRAREIAEADLKARGINAQFHADSGIGTEYGRRVWELEFRSNGQSIEYYIDVENGNIIKFEKW